MRYGRGKKVEKVEIPPGEALVYGVAVVFLFFFSLVALQIFYMVTFHDWSSDVWNGIMLVLGVVLGFFFGRKE